MKRLAMFQMVLTGAAMVALSSATVANAAIISANADAFQPFPGDASITLNFGGGPIVIPMEGAEFSNPGTSPYYPLTTAEVTRLQALAPNLGTVTYQLNWV